MTLQGRVDPIRVLSQKEAEDPLPGRELDQVQGVRESVQVGESFCRTNRVALGIGLRRR
jgi:hypothetical protein